jgi:hypothetical protein
MCTVRHDDAACARISAAMASTSPLIALEYACARAMRAFSRDVARGARVWRRELDSCSIFKRASGFFFKTK